MKAQLHETEPFREGVLGELDQQSAGLLDAYWTGLDEVMCAAEASGGLPDDWRSRAAIRFTFKYEQFGRIGLSSQVVQALLHGVVEGGDLPRLMYDAARVGELVSVRQPIRYRQELLRRDNRPVSALVLGVHALTASRIISMPAITAVRRGVAHHERRADIYWAGPLLSGRHLWAVQ